MAKSPERIHAILAALDIPQDLIRARSLPLCPEAEELVIAEADGSVTFRTAAPVLGLGEGGAQFDRRGHLHRLLNGQVSPPQAPLATHGGTILSPLRTDPWFMFWLKVRTMPEVRATSRSPSLTLALTCSGAVSSFRATAPATTTTTIGPIHQRRRTVRVNREGVGGCAIGCSWIGYYGSRPRRLGGAPPTFNWRR